MIQEYLESIGERIIWSCEVNGTRYFLLESHQNVVFSFTPHPSIRSTHLLAIPTDKGSIWCFGYQVTFRDLVFDIIDISPERPAWIYSNFMNLELISDISNFKNSTNFQLESLESLCNMFQKQLQIDRILGHEYSMDDLDAKDLSKIDLTTQRRIMIGKRFIAIDPNRFCKVQKSLAYISQELGEVNGFTVFRGMCGKETSIE